MRYMLALAGLSLSFAAFAQAPEDSAESVAAVLERLAAQRAGISTLTATIELANQSATEATNDTGDFVFRAPGRLLFALDNPGGEGYDTVYLLDGGRLYEHDRVIEQVQIYDFDGASRMGVLMTAFRRDLTRLSEQFVVALFEPGDYEDEAHIGLLLEPKPSEEEPPFQRVRLYLRAEDSLPVVVYVMHNSESSTTIRFAGYTKNDPLAPHQAQIAAPKGTVIVENEETFSTVEEDIRYLPAEDTEGDASLE